MVKKLEEKTKRALLLSELEFLQTLPPNTTNKQRITRIQNQLSESKTTTNQENLEKQIFSLLNNPNSIETRIFVNFAILQTQKSTVYDFTLVCKTKRQGIASKLEAIQAVRNTVFDAFETTMRFNSDFFAQGLSKEPWTGKATAQTKLPGILPRGLMISLEILDFALESLMSKTKIINFVNELGKKEGVLIKGEWTISYHQVNVTKTVKQTKIGGKMMERTFATEKRSGIDGLPRFRRNFGPDFLY